jgi:hypothetical protein
VLLVVQALMLSMVSPTPGEVFNIVDSDSSSRMEALQFAAHLRSVSFPCSCISAGAKHSRVVGAQVPSRGEKRVSNRKAVQTLGWVLQFPSFKDGLLDIAAKEHSALDA